MEFELLDMTHASSHYHYSLTQKSTQRGSYIPNRMKIHRDLTQPNLTHHNAVTPPCLSILLHVATFHADPIVIDLQSVNCTDRLCKLTGAYSRGGKSGAVAG